MKCTVDYNFKWHVLYLLNFSVRWNGSLCVALVFEPRTDGLQRSVSTAPAIVICPVLHVVMITVRALDHINLYKKKRGTYQLKIDAHMLCVHPSQVYCFQSLTVTVVPYKMPSESYS